MPSAIERRRAAMTFSTNEQLLIETRVSNDGKNVLVAYLLWFFLGVFSAHRFYLGRPGTAILQILSYFILIGFLWWVVDFFLIPGMVRGENDELRRRLADELVHR
jgi:TM2 domain-containing membrane protein YozV